MAVLPFVAKLIASSGLLYAYYYLFLRNKRFHRYNRFYLLGISLCSVLIPFLNIPVTLFWDNPQNATLIHTLKVININSWEEPVTIYARHSPWSRWITLQNGLYFVYLAGVLTGLVILIRSLAYIKGLEKKYPHETIGSLKIYNTAEPGTPFSYFRSIFWDKKISLHDEPGQQIFRHEMFHVKQRHSADILLLEILGCACWFNPFFHLIKKELKAIHEFLADAYAISGNNRYDYAELLVLHAIHQKTPGLIHPFFHNQVKRRITMITQSNLVRRSGYISRIMALPLVFLLVSAFAVKLTRKLPAAAAHYAGKTLTVVIDAGHGGIYPGTNTGNGMAEKDINLSIAQKIKELSAEYKVNIVLTRNSDELVGNATSLREDLLNRVEIASKARADLFVSIHVNATAEKTTDRSGFDVYISGKNEHPKDRAFASGILNSLKDIYAINNIRQPEVGIVVLDKNTCPAVCLECGYINNSKDAAFISNAANQKKIARKILEGIVQSQLQDNPAKETTQTEDRLITDTTLITGDAAKIKLMSAAKKQLEQTVAESKNGKSFSGVDKDNIPVVYRVEPDGAKQSNRPLTKVEIEAAYPGGSAAWQSYLFKKVYYPKEALDKEIKGTVIVQFVVNDRGKISDVKALDGPQLLRAESIRVIKESGTWIPAVNNGKKVKSYKRQPITYMLQRQG